jgi:hypothetical protein
MSSDNKKTKTDVTPKSDTAAKDKKPKSEVAAPDKTASGEAVAKAEGGETAAAAPASYSRGEGQKPVTRAYKENWNAIFAKKAAKKKKR